jgi:hypothetical protein
MVQKAHFRPQTCLLVRSAHSWKPLQFADNKTYICSKVSIGDYTKFSLYQHRRTRTNVQVFAALEARPSTRVWKAMLNYLRGRKSEIDSHYLVLGGVASGLLEGVTDVKGQLAVDV